MEDQNIPPEIKELFTKYLQKRGLRKTSERFEILKEIYKMSHFDSHGLYERMKDRKYRVSKATVYNTLELLCACGLVVKHHFGKNMSIFEKAYHYKQHNHLICLGCQKIYEFCDPRIQTTQSLLEEVYPIKITHHHLTFYGYCEDCKQKMPKEEEG